VKEPLTQRLQEMTTPPPVTALFVRAERDRTPAIPIADWTRRQLALMAE